MGKCQIAQKHYPAVSSFLKTSDNTIDLPPKHMYEMLCNYVGLIEDASNFASGILTKLDGDVHACLNGNGVAKKGIDF